MRTFIFCVLITTSLTACIPKKFKEEINKNLMQTQQMLADQVFKNAISHIELHKLRNGYYPDSLSQLQFLTAMDSSFLASVHYKKIDKGYELNLNYNLSATGTKNAAIELQYPAEFWKGLGLLKSNVKKD
ncbi:MAG: hypothetical protein K1X55_08435 [Chitinophagales bacterium]|nr:hypothetical protein [Chitinophagales bacterium]